MPPIGVTQQLLDLRPMVPVEDVDPQHRPPQLDDAQRDLGDLAQLARGREAVAACLGPLVRLQHRLDVLDALDRHLAGQLVEVEPLDDAVGLGLDQAPHPASSGVMLIFAAAVSWR